MRHFFAVCCILIITGNYNYLCSVPCVHGGVLCAYCVPWRDAMNKLQRDPFSFLWCSVCHVSFVQDRITTANENFKNKSGFHHHRKNGNFTESKSFHIYAALLFQTWEGNVKLCRDFKFSYIGGTGRENFCSVSSFR